MVGVVVAVGDASNRKPWILFMVMRQIENPGPSIPTFGRSKGVAAATTPLDPSVRMGAKIRDLMNQLNY